MREEVKENARRPADLYGFRFRSDQDGRQPELDVLRERAGFDFVVGFAASSTSELGLLPGCAYWVTRRWVRPACLVVFLLREGAAGR